MDKKQQERNKRLVIQLKSLSDKLENSSEVRFTDFQIYQGFLEQDYRYFDGYSYDSIAEIIEVVRDLYNISYSAVSEIVSAIIDLELDLLNTDFDIVNSRVNEKLKLRKNDLEGGF